MNGQTKQRVCAGPTQGHDPCDPVLISVCQVRISAYFGLYTLVTYKRIWPIRVMASISDLKCIIQ